jgi:2-haloacid dehalogenase
MASAAAWPDARRGLALLKRDYVIATLSNGNIALLGMAKNAGLPWDASCRRKSSALQAGPGQCLGAADALGLAPAQVMMVAAHKSDLRAAKACGLKTAFVRRPKEHGPNVRVDLSADRAFEFNADDFVDLARQMRKKTR